MTHPGHPSHKKKAAILMITLVIGAILILLLMNDEGKLSLTSSIIGVEGEGKETALNEGGQKIDLKLTFDAAPEVKEETLLESVKVTFNDLNTKLKINEEELELKEGKGGEMEIFGFEGEVDFNEASLSLKGKGEKVTVNGVGISTQGKMVISFNGLAYQALELKGIELDLVEFKEGSGQLTVGEKMGYKLENEGLKIAGFKGILEVNSDKESLAVLEGQANGLSVQGQTTLTLN